MQCHSKTQCGWLALSWAIKLLTHNYSPVFPWWLYDCKTYDFTAPESDNLKGGFTYNWNWLWVFVKLGNWHRLSRSLLKVLCSQRKIVKYFFWWLLWCQRGFFFSVMNRLRKGDVSAACYCFWVTCVLADGRHTAVDIPRVGSFWLICHQSSPTHNFASEFLQLTSSPSCCRRLATSFRHPPHSLPSSPTLPPGLSLHPPSPSPHLLLFAFGLHASLRGKLCQRRLSHCLYPDKYHKTSAY